MNLKELKESLNEAKDAKKALLSKAVEEIRSLDSEEDNELRLLDEKISNLQKQIENAEQEIRNNSVETKIINKGEIKHMKTKEELRSEFLQALATNPTESPTLSQALELLSSRRLLTPYFLVFSTFR